MPKGWKLTAEQTAEVVDRYAAEETTYALAARFGLDRQTISSTLKRCGVTIRTTAKLTGEQRTEAVRLYVAGQSAQQVADKFGVADESVRMAVIKSGAVMRSRREARTEHAVRHDAFDVLTPDAAYWCGFIFTDGCINANRVSVEIAACDRQHLVKLRAFLEAGHAITARPARLVRSGNGRVYMGKPQCALKVLSDRMTEQLLSLGRYEGEIAAELVGSCHFWRGAVDGDGSIGIYHDRRRPHLPGYPAFHLYGERRLLEAFNGFLAANGLPERTIHPLNGLFQAAARCGPAVPIIDLLYRDAPTVLERKAVIAASILERRDRAGPRSTRGPARFAASTPAEATPMLPHGDATTEPAERS